jgi:hypothetical protein
MSAFFGHLFSGSPILRDSAMGALMVDKEFRKNDLLCREFAYW